MLQTVGSSVGVPESRTGSSRRSAHLYQNLALLECADAATLDEVTAGPLGRYVEPANLSISVGGKMLLDATPQS
jgi:hypothetical protein